MTVYTILFTPSPKKFASQSRAKLSKDMELKDTGVICCPECGTGQLRCKANKQGRLFWYCSNWNAPERQCKVIFADELGRPVLPEIADA